MSWIDRVHENAATLYEQAVLQKEKLAVVKLLLLQRDVEGALRELEDVDVTRSVDRYRREVGLPVKGGS